MILLSTNKVEDCFDGSSVYEFVFASPLSEKTIKSFNSLGELEYFPKFPRPFFRVIQKEGVQIKGVEGETSCRIILPRKNKEVLMITIKSFFGNL